MAVSLNLDSDYNFLVGTYSNLDVLAHQPHAPSSGAGIYSVAITKGGVLTQADVTECLNPAVLIPHSNGKLMYAIVETIKSNGEVLQYGIDDKAKLSLQSSFTASGKSTCYILSLIHI